MNEGKSHEKAPDAPESHDLSGQTIAGFRVLRKLGAGGMGQVYLAEQLSLKRSVALKILRPEMATNATAMARFKAEATNVARATHANIVQVYDFGVADGVAYMAMEYVEGRNLKEYIARKGSPDVVIAVSIMRQVASALQRAGELGLIHRDIKPENILLTRKGEAKVADFGLVRCLQGDKKPALHLTQTGVTMGTPLYMSPEQVEGKPVDPRTDIYSFGVTCYHMLTGQPPFLGESAFEVALQHVQKQPVPLTKVRPDLPEPLCAIVHKMMQKDPEQRYQNGKELLRDIIKLRENLSGGTAPLASQPAIAMDQPTINTTMPASTVAVPAPVLASPTSKRSWAATALVLLVATTTLAAVGGGALMAWRDRQNTGPMPFGQEIPPADATVTESLALPSKHEQTLRDAVEQYLNPSKGKVADQAGGFGTCTDLALWYLDTYQLDDAEALFMRLEGMKEARSYMWLGQLGKGIVLALKDRPQESAKAFRAFTEGSSAPPRPFFEREALAKGIKGKPGMSLPQALAKSKEKYSDGMIKDVLQLVSLCDHPRWRYWLGQARWYNNANGLAEKELPYQFVQAFPLTQAPAPKDKQPKDDKSPKDKVKDKGSSRDKDKVFFPWRPGQFRATGAP